MADTIHNTTGTGESSGGIGAVAVVAIVILVLAAVFFGFRYFSSRGTVQQPGINVNVPLPSGGGDNGGGTGGTGGGTAPAY